MNHFHGNNWRIQGDSRNAHFPDSISFIFMQFLTKPCQIIGFRPKLRGLYPWGILNPPLETTLHQSLSIYTKVNCFLVDLDFPVNNLTHSRVTDPLMQCALLIDELLASRIVHARLICQ